jgi:ankyrin repeat protein
MALSVAPRAGIGAGFLVAIATAVVALAVVIALAAAVHRRGQQAPAPAIVSSRTNSREAVMSPADEVIDQALLMQAVDLVQAGDTGALASLLRQHPALVRARVASDQGRYAGFFHHPTLLHHTAGNAYPPHAPANTVEVARLLLDAGAEVDARTDVGPAQPGTEGGTTLSLAVTAGEEGIGERIDPLVDLLVERGADVNDRNGAPMAGALYYHFRRGVRALLRHGAQLDLRTAANVGDLERLRSFFAADGSLLPNAIHLDRYGLPPVPSDRAGILADALMGACNAAGPGQAPVARFLIEHGADATAMVGGSTPLHHAAIEGDLPLVRLLLEHGADRTVHDAEHNGTPSDWAREAQHADCAQLIDGWTGADFR